jgi:hypothetical protein
MLDIISQTRILAQAVIRAFDGGEHGYYQLVEMSTINHGPYLNTADLPFVIGGERQSDGKDKRTIQFAIIVGDTE